MAVEGRLIIAFVMFCTTLCLIAIFFIVRRKKEKAFNYEEKLRAKMEELEHQQEDDVLKPLNVTRFVYDVEKQGPTKMKIESLMNGEGHASSAAHAEQLAVFQKKNLLQDHVTFNSHFNCFLTEDNIQQAEDHGNIFRVGLRIERMHTEADVVDDEDYEQRITDMRKQARVAEKHARQGRDHLRQMVLLNQAGALADADADGEPMDIGRTALKTILGGGSVLSEKEKAAAVAKAASDRAKKKKPKVTSGLELMVQESQARRAAEDVVTNDRVATEVAFMNPHDLAVQSGDSSAVLSKLTPRAVVERHLLDDESTREYHNIAAATSGTVGANPTQPSPLTSLVGSDALGTAADVSKVAGIVAPYAPVRSHATQPHLSSFTDGNALTPSSVGGHNALSVSAVSSAHPLRVKQHGGEITHETPVVTEPLTGQLFTSPAASSQAQTTA